MGINGQSVFSKEADINEKADEIVGNDSTFIFSKYRIPEKTLCNQSLMERSQSRKEE
jgi:hypothetical protein